jgi:hypothetical protein
LIISFNGPHSCVKGLNPELVLVTDKGSSHREERIEGLWAKAFVKIINNEASPDAVLYKPEKESM